MALFTSVINQCHGSAQGETMEANFHILIFGMKEIHPGVQVFHVMYTPVCHGAITFPMAPEVYKKYIVSQIPIYIYVGKTHRSILVQPVKQDYCLFTVIPVFNVGSSEVCTVSGRHCDPMPTVTVFHGMDGREIFTMVFNAQNPVPGSRK